MSACPRIAWMSLFAIAFGWLEAAVVIYLRRLYYPDGFQFPLRPIEDAVLAVELLREAATLLMLVSVAALAGRGRWQKFGFFCLGFGIWDLMYYLGLRWALGWPDSLQTWDILFLWPVPWLAPVYAPMSVALLMVMAGAWTVRSQAQGRRGLADRWTWLLGAVGVLILLYSFMRDTAAGLRQAQPQSYPLVLFLPGLALLAACCVRFLRGDRSGSRERRAP